MCPEFQKQLILLNLNGVETSTNAQNAQVEYIPLCVGGFHEPDPWCTLFLVTAQLTRAVTLENITSCFHAVRVPEKGISSDPQHFSW